MSIEELRRLLIQELEPAFFVGRYGGAEEEIEEIKTASVEKLIEIASRHGYVVTIEEEQPNQKRKK